MDKTVDIYMKYLEDKMLVLQEHGQSTEGYFKLIELYTEMKRVKNNVEKAQTQYGFKLRTNDKDTNNAKAYLELCQKQYSKLLDIIIEHKKKYNIK